jgi:hypothetical protein
MEYIVEHYEGVVNEKNFKVDVTIENNAVIQIAAMQDGKDISQRLLKQKYVFHYENFKKVLELKNTTKY